jgi:hypothetical protein
MRAIRFTTVTMACAMVTASFVLVTTHAQVKTPPQGILAEPPGNAAGPIFAAFEGWGPLRDGTNALLIGYFNRNKTQELDIPIGPENNIEPGGPDQGQPTHFLTGRQYGMFAITVPKDFGTKKLTWTIVANGQKTAVTLWMNPPYWVDFFKHAAKENEPPRIKFAMNGPDYMGPPSQKTVATLNATVGQPLDLTAWAADQPAKRVFEATPPGGDSATPAAGAGRGGAGRGGAAANPNDPLPAFIGGRVVPIAPAAGGGAAAAAEGRRPRGDIQVIWKKYRGPGDVKIGNETIALENGGDPNKWVEAKTTATFSAPGTYWLRAQVNDASGNGGGGDQCCWTSAHIIVNVK